MGVPMGVTSSESAARVEDLAGGIKDLEVFALPVGGGEAIPAEWGFGGRAANGTGRELAAAAVIAAVMGLGGSGLVAEGVAPGWPAPGLWPSGAARLVGVPGDWESEVSDGGMAEIAAGWTGAAAGGEVS